MADTFPAVIGVLEGLHWHGEPLRLSDRAQLRASHSSERFFFEDLVRSNQKSGRALSIQPLERDSCLLELSLAEEALMLIRRSPEEIHRVVQEHFTGTLTQLRLFKAGQLGCRAVLVPLSNQRQSFAVAETPGQRGCRREFLPTTFNLDAEERKQLKDWLELPWAPGFAARPEVNWFNRAYAEASVHDWVTDVFCAIEYATFQGDTERATQRYPFGLRGAWTIGTDFDTRRSVSRDLQRFYDLRHSVAHCTAGNSFNRNEQQLLQRVEEYLRRILAVTLTRGSAADRSGTDDRILAGLGLNEDFPQFSPLPERPVEAILPPPAPSPPPRPSAPPPRREGSGQRPDGRGSSRTRQRRRRRNRSDGGGQPSGGKRPPGGSGH